MRNVVFFGKCHDAIDPPSFRCILKGVVTPCPIIGRRCGVIVNVQIVGNHVLVQLAGALGELYTGINNSNQSVAVQACGILLHRSARLLGFGYAHRELCYGFLVSRAPVYFARHR
jgi:hypothetical protein